MAVGADGGTRVIRRSFLSLMATLAATGCSSDAILNGLAPSRLVADGVPYLPGPRHQLDVYAPGGPGPYPVVVFLYGGAWDSGDRGLYRFLGGALASRGVVVVVPDYRVYPAVRFPGFLEDNAAAVRWARDTIGQYGGDPATLFVMGHSAGAYDAAMLGLDPQWLHHVGMAPRDLRGVIGISGPYDFVPDTPELKDIFGAPELLRQRMPIDFVDRHAPPMLLLTGTADTTVRPANTTRLAEKVRQAGGIVQERYYQGIGHIEIIGAVGAPLHFLAPTLRDCLAFMDRPG